MSFAEVVPYLLLLVKGALILVAVVFFLSGLDDFFIDLVHIFRSLYRRWFVLPKHPALTEEHLLLPKEQPLAIMMPAWEESAVVRRTVEHALQTVHYANYHIFVGTYPNDDATQEEVEAVAASYDHVHQVVCPHDGPTSKADCLNWIFQGIHLFEKEHRLQFQIFVIQDAEDIVHPLSLKLFNYLIPRKDMVQLPVFPLETEWYHFTAWHYADEFAENHSKDLVVRERLSRFVPSAGVGCAFSRRAMDLVAGDHRNELFNLDSVTEDYDFAFRLTEHGLEQVFVRQSIERSKVERSIWTGKPRSVTVKERIATREFFPRTFRAAVRQKSRWVVGIALQGWAQLGWRGSGWTKYMLARDRKALLTNQINVLGYVVLLALIAVWLAPRLFPDAYRYPPLVARGSWLWYLILVDTFFLAFRVGARAAYVGLVYNWRQALLSVLRQIWANVINFAASVRACWIFGVHLITGKPIGWEKTEHTFPSEAELRAFHRKLGDLLVQRRHITREQLNRALERQKEDRRPLGAVLVSMGLVEESSLVQALGTQLHLSTREIDPYLVPLELLRLVPKELAARYSVFPVELRADGRLVLAIDRTLSRRELDDIEKRLERAVELCLSTHSDVAFAVQRGYERLDQESVDVSPLGQKLVERGWIDADQLQQALTAQRQSHAWLGDVLLEEGMLTAERLDQALKDYSAHGNSRLGTFLVQHDYISLEQLQRALDLQRSRFRRLGEVLVSLGMISQPSLEQVLEEPVP